MDHGILVDTLIHWVGICAALDGHLMDMFIAPRYASGY